MTDFFLFKFKNSALVFSRLALSNPLPFARAKGSLLYQGQRQKDEYIKIFWVGLIDGDGSIQVNHWRKKSLQFRLVIKLSNITSNYNMLLKIAKVIGGNVRITGKGADAIWVVNKKETVIEIIKIFETYPLLTSRKICQLLFLKKCLLENSVDFYLVNRDNKYTNQKDIIKSFETCRPARLKAGRQALLFSNYFKSWLSGFIEAEGCFSIRKNNNHSFSIGQNDDFYLINRIKEYTKSTNIIRNTPCLHGFNATRSLARLTCLSRVSRARVNASTGYGIFYSLEIYKKETLKQFINHFYYFPLLGEKAESLKRFNQII